MNRKTFNFVLLVIAAVFLLFAAAGVGSWGLGSITVQNLPAGLLFYVVARMARE